METIYWYQSEVFRLPYTEKFLGLIEMKSTEHGLRADISLSDAVDDYEINIGTIISSEYDIGDCHEYGCNMLKNKEYCMDIWNDEKRRK